MQDQHLAFFVILYILEVHGGFAVDLRGLLLLALTRPIAELLVHLVICRIFPLLDRLGELVESCLRAVVAENVSVGYLEHRE